MIKLLESFKGIEARAESGDVSGALEWVSGALEQRSNGNSSALLHWLQGRILALAHRHIEAVSSFRRALELGPPQPLPAAVRYDLGRAWHELGEYGEAKTELERCIQDTSEAYLSPAAKAHEWLSIIAEEEGDFDAARRKALDANEIWRRAGDDEEEARSLRRTGQLERRVGEYAASRRLLEQAAKIHEQAARSDLAAEVHTELAEIINRLGDAASAQEAARAGVRLSRTCNTSHLPRALYVYGLLLRESDTSGSAAESTLQEAIALALEIGDYVLAAQASGDLAGALASRSKLDEAITWNELSRSNYELEGNLLGQVFCYRNLAEFFRRAGRREEALEALSTAREMARALGDKPLSASLSLYGATELGLHAAEQTVFLDALEMQVDVLRHVSKTHEELEARVTEAHSGLLDQMGEVTPMEGLSRIFNLAHQAAAADRVRIAIGIAVAALERWREHRGNSLPKLRIKFGSMLLRVGDNGRARDELRRAMAECSEFGDQETTLVCANELARAEQACGDVAAAQEILLEALGRATSPPDLDSLKMNLAVSYMAEWRFREAEPLLVEVVASATSRNQTKSLVYALSNLAALKADTGRIDEAIQTLERIGDAEKKALLPHQLVHVLSLEAHVLELSGRVRDALDTYNEAFRVVESARSELVSTRIQSWYSSSLYPMYSDAVRLAAKTDAEMALFFAEHSRARALASGIAGPRGSPTMTVDRHLIPRIRARLRPGEVIVSYYLTDSRLYCWVVTAAELRCVAVEVSRAKLVEVVAEYQRGLDRSAESPELRQELTNILLTPLGDFLDGNKTVYFVAHGPLHMVPFAALGRTERLVLKVDLATIPALHLLDRRGPWQSSWSDSSLIIADPLGDLSGARDEAAIVASATSESTMVIGDEATRDAFLDGLSTRQTVHIASHACFDASDPMASGVVLAGPDGSADLISVADLLRLPRIEAKLIVLSACETRLTAGGPSDDSVGVAPALLIAGAETVIGTLWKVADAAAVETMKLFYAHLVGGSPPVAALSQAQREMDNMGWGPESWAAFQCYTLASGERFRSVDHAKRP